MPKQIKGGELYKNYPKSVDSMSSKYGTSSGVRKGFFQTIRESFKRYRQRQYIEKLKKFEKDVDDSREQAKLNLFIAQFYARELNDEEEALKHYRKAQELSGAQALGYPDSDWQNKLINPVEQLQDFSNLSLIEIGRFYKQQKKPHLATKAFRRVVKNYKQTTRGITRPVPFSRKNTKTALEELVVLRARRGESFPPYKYAGDDPVLELRKIVKHILNSMVRDKPKDLRPLIPPQGIESGLEPMISTKMSDLEDHYSQEAIYYQLEEKEGPHYEQLFGWLKENNIKADNIKYVISAEDPNLYLVQVIYDGKNKKQKLYFELTKTDWYLRFIGLD
ncbi:hypothetical protein ACFL5G_03720 [Candidatus Margulisiibacteriota bacterium]